MLSIQACNFASRYNAVSKNIVAPNSNRINKAENTSFGLAPPSDGPGGKEIAALLAALAIAAWLISLNLK